MPSSISLIPVILTEQRQLAQRLDLWDAECRQKISQVLVKLDMHLGAQPALPPEPAQKLSQKLRERSFACNGNGLAKNDLFKEVAGSSVVHDISNKCNGSHAETTGLRSTAELPTLKMDCRTEEYDAQDPWDPAEANGLRSARKSRQTGIRNVLDDLKEKDSLVSERVNMLNLLDRTEDQNPIELSAMQRFVEGSCFHWSVTVLVVLNTVMLGVEAELRIQDAQEDPMTEVHRWVWFVNLVFLILFGSELSTRVAAWRCAFLFGTGWASNCFDTFLVLLQLMETVLDSSQAGALRATRLLRLTRILRLVRFARAFQPLQKLISGMANTLVPLFWANVFMILVTYAFSIAAMFASIEILRDPPETPVPSYLTDSGSVAAAELAGILHPAELAGAFQADYMGPAAQRQQVKLYFSSLPRSMWSLILCITGGLDWYHVAKPLLNADPAYAFLFTAYVMFQLFCVLNVLAAMFVESALKTRDKHLLAMQEVEKIDHFLADMANLFKEADSDGDTVVSREELCAYLSNEQAAAYLRSQGLGVTDIAVMFDLLDEDGSGTIDMIEFLQGTIRLKDYARTFEIMNMLVNLNDMRSHITQIEDALGIAAADDADEQANAEQLQAGTKLC